ncbi:autotransporter outer membrane beta-barrel domain-containing protein [Pseudomonas sp. B6002]|uniref:autotransporter family protein n=1 Tax=Pseudomonas sp. B6002 TaxID=2726978 RepID=UPI0015A18607|nr:autotransporter outer membrane beta-barrel domain-containing protein [Pseudomonas sp. B6002]NVZ50677.1 autotransporter outer membrane beta-barrel domain-containing protein [Pseudomonas sp. B6002]
MSSHSRQDLIPVVLTILAIFPVFSQAACVVTPGPTGQVFTCTSGTDPGINAPTGDNEVLFPSGNAAINGNVTLGAGNDLFQLDAAGATINGSVDMGDGANIFRLNLGTVTGTVTQGAGADVAQISGGKAGAIIQGDGVDSFSISGGTVASVAQGDGHDKFFMSGGTITGAFEDGDDAKMTGGSIGRVDMKLDNNLFDMSGGTIIGNLVTGFGNDTILISGTSYIGGNVSTSGGTDLITLTGGTINGQILASTGTDHFSWIGGGSVNGFILMGPDNDTALLQNLNQSMLSSTPLIDGGTGADTLTFDNTQADTPGRYTNWELVTLDNNATFKLGGAFVLGDVDTGTGTMTLNGSSKLLVDTGAISAFTSGQLAQLNNGGMIDMTTGSSTAADTLTVNGNYNGTGGTLALQTVLGTDGSASDKLVIGLGTIQGNTGIRITNLGGTGATTLQDGIQVVQAINGATGSAGAFSLAAPVSAGAFDYYLFKGGVTPGTAENYYLRSTIPVTPADPVIVVPLPAPGTPLLPTNPGITPIPLYRPEVSVYAALFPATQQIVQGMLGTYHERMGEQSQQQHTDASPASWGRMYGRSTRQSFTGTVSPTLDSSITGFQVGSDLYVATSSTGQTQRAGVFIGHSRLSGDVKGFNGGFQDKDAGNATLRGDSLGAYWTLVGANRAYLDLVLMGTRFNGNNTSDRGVKMKTGGSNLLASAEAGWPFPVSSHWELEPQAQVIVDRTRLDNQNDGFSEVTFHSDTNLVTRLGARLRGNYQVSGLPVQPYARVNVWHASAGTHTVRFNDVTDIDTEQQSTTLDLKLGATLNVAEGVSLYGEVGYNRNLDSNALNGREGTVGLRMAF